VVTAGATGLSEPLPLVECGLECANATQQAGGQVSGGARLDLRPGRQQLPPSHPLHPVDWIVMHIGQHASQEGLLVALTEFCAPVRHGRGGITRQHLESTLIQRQKVHQQKDS